MKLVAVLDYFCIGQSTQQKQHKGQKAWWSWWQQEHMIDSLIDASAELRARAEFFPPGAYRAKTAQLPAPILPADSEQTLTSETYGGTLDSSLNISHPIFPMKWSISVRNDSGGQRLK